ncbi:hypothetical protein JCM11251_000136 [Rhodosporidiobolus azoricus]
MPAADAHTPPRAQPRLAHLLTSLIASPSIAPAAPIPDDTLLALAAVVGNQLLLDALDLIDRDKVTRLTPPSSRPIYLVASSSSSSGGSPAPASYHVVPDINLGGSAGGWCPCPAFAKGVVGNRADGVICKHLLAVLLSLRLSPSPTRRTLTTTTTSAGAVKPSSSSFSSVAGGPEAEAKKPPDRPALHASTTPSQRPRPRPVFVEKRATLEWVAGWATKFGATTTTGPQAANPPPAAETWRTG